jgi:protein tyrosine phosphatase (PTP) superfamily phosphohydrolase (DUF442 family)
MRNVSLLAFIVMAGLLTGCSTQRGFAPTHGIVNLDRVDGKVWRCAQPNRLGLEWLKEQGVDTVINLRHDPWPDEKAICQELGIRYHWIPLSGVRNPTDFQTKLVLGAIENARGQVLLHCQFGADRTGTMVACYRIRNGMTPQDAFEDAKVHGISPLLCGMKEYILHFQ